MMWEKSKFGGDKINIQPAGCGELVARNQNGFKEGLDILWCYGDKDDDWCANIHVILNPEGKVIGRKFCIGYISKLQFPHPSYEV